MYGIGPEPFLLRIVGVEFGTADLRPAGVLMRTMMFRALAALTMGALAVGALTLSSADAQAPRRPEIPYLPFRPVNPASPTPANPQSDLDKLKQQGRDLEAIRAEQTRAMENEIKLKREIEAIGNDRRQLNQQLIDTAARIRAMEEQVAAAQDRLKPLDLREAALRRSLEGRRAIMAEVLASLQRIGRHPPPALMVSPQDALQSLRSAMLLGAVLPAMRHEADLLIADLIELTRVREEIAAQRDALNRDLVAQEQERQRLALLTDQRQKQQAEDEKSLGQERQRLSELARSADSLKDLMAKLEQSLPPAARAARANEARAANAGTDVAALKDPGRLEPAIAFASAKGRLPLPVNGVRIKEFGAPDGIGGTEKGLTVATRPGAQITAPCDGWVVYSGTFRNYGQLLILNAGSGYHVLLAGMDRISVDLGQFVVTGEPVAVMGGGGGQLPAALAASSGQPVLYVEFRKDGTPVDPSPWWATSEGEKVRG
jgi:septal ring factor EnvC (AmiA/AmiB activator)